MRRALARDFSALPDTEVIMTFDSRLVATESDGLWKTVTVGIGGELDTFENLACRGDTWTLVIAPETDGILGERARLIESLQGARSLGSNSEAIGATSDKLDLAHLWVEHGINTPETWRVEPNQPLPPDASYPAILKPIDGAGCLDTFLVHSASEAPETTCKAIIQEYISGMPMSATFLIDATDQAHLIAVGTQFIDCEEGRLRYRGGRLPEDRRLCDANVRAALTAVSGLRGLVGIDFISTASGSVVIEINPRPTTSIVGILSILEPGILAKAWIDSMAGPYCGPDLANLVDQFAVRNFHPNGIVDL